MDEAIYKLSRQFVIVGTRVKLTMKAKLCHWMVGYKTIQIAPTSGCMKCLKNKVGLVAASNKKYL